MKRTLLLIPTLAMFFTIGCAARAYYVGPPPPARVEAYGYAPGPGYVWIGGFWDWRDRYVWTPGYWARPPHARAVWVSGRGYYNHGRYYYKRGYWR